MDIKKTLVLVGAAVGLLLGIFQKNTGMPASFFHVIPFPLISAAVGAIVGELIADIATSLKKE